MFTGLVVKCHVSRCQDENRKMARQLLVAKLDDMLNGDDSVNSQKKRISENKYKKAEYKRKKLVKLKNEWKKREGLD